MDAARSRLAEIGVKVGKSNRFTRTNVLAIYIQRCWHGPSENPTWGEVEEIWKKILFNCMSAEMQ